MTVIFATNEVAGMFRSDPVTITTDGNFGGESGFQRAPGLIEFNADTGPTNYCSYDIPDTYTELWFQCKTLTQNEDEETPIITLYDTTSGNDVVGFRVNADDPDVIDMFYYDGSTIQIVDSFTKSPSTVEKLTCFIKKANTGGIIRWYREGVLQAEFTGDTDFGLDFDQLRVYHWSNVTNTTGEVILSTVSPITFRVATLTPNGNGSLAEATSGNFQDVDQNDINDVSAIVSYDTAGQRQTYTFTSLSDQAENFEIKAVCHAIYARNNGGTPANAKSILYVNGTTYDGSTHTLNSGFSSDNFSVWNDNPDTDEPWTLAEVNGIEAGTEAA